MKILGYRYFWRTLLAICLLSSPFTWSAPESSVALANSNATCQLTWNRVAAPLLGSDPLGFYDLVAVAPNTVLASGKSGDYPNPRALLLRWDRSGWKQDSFPEELTFGAILGGSSPDNLWAMGMGYRAIYHWDGVLWSVKPSPPTAMYSARYTAMAVPSKKFVWAVGNDNWYGSTRTVIARWNGKKWKQFSSPNTHLPHTSLKGIAVLSRKDAWAVGTGTNWTVQNPQPLRQRAFVIHWDGKEWTKARIPGRGGASLNAIAAVNPNDIWAVGEKTKDGATSPYLIHWNGKRWKQFAAPPPPEPSGLLAISSVAAVAADDVWTVGGMGDTASEIPIVLHWNGHRWQSVTPPPTKGLQKIVALSQNDVRVLSYAQIAEWNGTGWEWAKLPNVGEGTAYFNVSSG